MNTYKSEGIVLKRSNFGEADKIVTIYSKHHGKITFLAKGIRRLSSRKRGNLEIFNKVSFFATQGKSMDIVTETELLNSYAVWRDNLPKIAAAYQLCEMVDKMTVEGNDQEEVYYLLNNFLDALQKIPLANLNLFTRDFGGKLIKLLGFWPKDKIVPSDFNTISFIEEIIEKDLKSKKFSLMV